MMKLHFEPDLDFQLQAIDSVRDLFHGQEVGRSTFTVLNEDPESPMGLPFVQNDLGIGNRLTLSDERILENLHAVQLRNGLPPSESLQSGDFTVEMETGTGKTYVYLRTIFELNKAYGFIKFVIVVPSVAIKEGVYKSLEMTASHFRTLYSGTPFEYFLYDSAKLGRVSNFATSPHIQIMVITVGAINKKSVNNLYKNNERTGGDAPIDLIKATHPVIIVDEPQTVDGGLQGRGKEALAAMAPLCTLRYSATHVDEHHKIYRLGAVDAYQRKLVKQIEVASATVESAYNNPYVRLLSTSNRRGNITARVELDVATSTGVRRSERTVQGGDDLGLISERAAIYEGCRVGEIRAQHGGGFVELRVPGEEVFLQIGESWGDVDSLAVQREMIRRTIREHLAKEKGLVPQGIKVLSLFFIDQVDRYRRYDNDGNPQKGIYGQLFEEEFQRAARHPDYRDLFEGADLDAVAREAHGGYFSIDRMGGWTDTAENNEANRDNAERAYNLIMKDKESLLSLDTPLKFIFSHSALREGWDNPNVFQICTLRDMRTERERRQTIGRGLRLCVNQEGKRLRGFEVNTLTVIAAESYEEFAEKLQQEIEAETGMRFGIVEPHHFAGIPVMDGSGRQSVSLGYEASKALWEHLRDLGHIDSEGRIQESLRHALVDEDLILPDMFEQQRDMITGVLHRLAGRLEVKNADERRIVPTRQAVLHSAEFKALWDRVKHKTSYRVAFDNDQLITQCITALQNAPRVPRTRLEWRKADISIGQSGIDVSESAGATTVVLDEADVLLPDLLSELENRTHLTRRSLQRILVGSGRLDEFRRNPQHFIEIAAQQINLCKRRVLVDGIRYQRLGDEHYYAQELFEQEELTGYLRNLLAAEKSVYEQTVCDSRVERSFADRLEKNAAVKVYAKLPGWFTVSTPLGGYSPDWAVLIEGSSGQRLYFVVETKASRFSDDVRDSEKAKIECGKRHFDALGGQFESPAKYEVAAGLEEFLASTTSV